MRAFTRAKERLWVGLVDGEERDITRRDLLRGSAIRE